MKVLSSVALFLLPILLCGQHLLDYDRINDPSQWQLVFEDEFDNYGSNPKKMDIVNGGPYKPYLATCESVANGDRNWGTLELDPNNGGFLTINAIDYKDSIGGLYAGFCNENPIPEDFEYRSGGIVFAKDDVSPGIDCSSATDGYRYGLFEMRCKLPDRDDSRPAFWFYNGPEEIDILEHSVGKTLIETNIHDRYGGDATEPQPNGPFILEELEDGEVLPDECLDGTWSDCEKTYCQVRVDMKMDLSDDFHNYSLMWVEDVNTGETIFTWFMDGREIRTETRYNIWNCPHPFIINLGMNPGAVGNAAMIIDYVRVYQQQATYSTGPYLYSHDNSTRVDESVFLKNKYKNFSINKQNGNVFAELVLDGGIVLYDINDNIESVSPSNPIQNYKVDGDITAGYNDHIYYRGYDGKLQQYYRSLSTSTGWEHATIDWTSFGYEIHDNCGSLDFGEQSGLFYRGSDNQMHKFHYNPGGSGDLGNGWIHNTLDIVASGDGNRALWKVDGEVSAVYQRVYYRGVDGKLQSYYWAGNSWAHETINLTDLVSPECGAIEAVNRAAVFYRGTDDRLYASSIDDTGTWVHEKLPATISIQYVTGDIAIGNNKVYYRGGNGQVQFYQMQADRWMHGFINKNDETFPITTEVGNSLEISPFEERIYFDVVLESPPFIFDLLHYYSRAVEDEGHLKDIQCIAIDDDNDEPDGDPDNDSAIIPGIPPENPNLLIGGDNEVFGNIETELPDHQIIIYPNPSNGNFNIKFGAQMIDSTSPINISVFDASGRNIQQAQCLDNCSNYNLDLSTEADGIYFVKMIQDGMVNVKRIVKQ